MFEMAAPEGADLGVLSRQWQVISSTLKIARFFDQFKGTHKPRISLSDLTKTDINGFLVEGPDDELVFLINNTGHGNAIRNLHGKIVFVDGKATVCLAHPSDDFDRFTLLQIGLEVEAKGASKVSLSGDPCPIDPVGTYDVIVIDRDHWLRTSRETVQILLDGVEKGELSKFAVLSKSEIKDRANQESVESLELQTSIMKGSISGYGIVTVENNSAVICQTVEDGYPVTHKTLIDSKLERLRYEFKSAPRVVQTTIDSAYIALQRGDCRAIYGTAAGLKKVLEGIQRDKLKYYFLPVWFSVDDFEKQKERIATILAECLQRSIDIIRKQQDEDAQRKRRLEQNEQSRQQLQEELRRANGSAARSFENAIHSEIKQYTDSPKERNFEVRQKYPQFTAWYDNNLRDGWELVDIGSGIEDYGVVEWKNRVLEAGFVHVQVKMRNWELGEYRNNCYVLAYVLDKEFDIGREPMVAACDAGAIAQYKIAHRFSSRWLVSSSSTGSSATAAPSLPPELCGEWQEGSSGRETKQ
jgi:hypothetical protein